MLIPPLDGQIPTILNHLVILVDQEIAGDALLQKVQCSTLCSWDCGSLCGTSGVPPDVPLVTVDWPKLPFDMHARANALARQPTEILQFRLGCVAPNVRKTCGCPATPTTATATPHRRWSRGHPQSGPAGTVAPFVVLFPLPLCTATGSSPGLRATMRCCSTMPWTEPAIWTARRMISFSMASCFPAKQGWALKRGSNLVMTSKRGILDCARSMPLLGKPNVCQQPLAKLVDLDRQIPRFNDGG